MLFVIMHAYSYPMIADTVAIAIPDSFLVLVYASMCVCVCVAISVVVINFAMHHEYTLDTIAIAISRFSNFKSC